MKDPSVPFIRPTDLKRLEIVGMGGGGRVRKALHIPSGDVVAIKEVCAYCMHLRIQHRMIVVLFCRFPLTVW